MRTLYFHPVVYAVFFPRLISAVADWMSAILPHMVWPYCEFKMQVSSVLHAARCKYRTQKIAIWAPSHNFEAPLQISTGFASWQPYCAALEYWASATLCSVKQRAPPIFGRAAITLGIAHISSIILNYSVCVSKF